MFGDGFLTVDELKAGRMGQKNPAKAEKRFKKMDTDADGKLSLAEFMAGAGHGKGHKSHKQQS